MNLQDQNKTENKTSDKNFLSEAHLSTSSAIIIGAFIIASSVLIKDFYFRSLSVNSAPSNNQIVTAPENIGLGDSVPVPSGDIEIREITQDDHIRGDANAVVTLVEYSDLECPFCKKVHPTFQQLIKEYEGRVRWVYRHFPLDALHSKARKEAEASECANELGGNDKFWAYVDRLFEVTPSNDGLDPSELPKIAEYVGLSTVKFQACLDSGKYTEHVAEDLVDAQTAGGTGTPHNVIIAQDGTKYPVVGAQPYEQFKTVIEQALR